MCQVTQQNFKNILILNVSEVFMTIRLDICITKTGYLPVVPHSPSNPEVVEESISTFQNTARELLLNYTVVSCDQAVCEIEHTLRVKNLAAYSEFVL